MLPGTPLLSPATLLKALRQKRANTTAGPRYFAYGRDALASYLTEAGTKASVLYAPSYICTEATHPLASIQQEVRYYPVLDSLEPDWDWLSAHADQPGQAALLLVHYFGFSNATEAALDFSRRRRLLLIEDCAHSFLTRDGGRETGSIGDAGFYSYRKILPLPDGAGLVVKRHDDSPPDPDQSLEFAGTSYLGITRQLLKYVLYKAGAPSRIWSSLAALDPHRNGAPRNTADTSPPAMTSLSRRVMKALEPSFDAIVTIRRRNYRRLTDAFSQFPEVTLPYPRLTEGVCPYLFPLLLKDRDPVRGALRRLGVPAGTWPILPGAVLANPSFHVAHRFARELMTLPVHQDLKPAHMDTIVHAYQRVRDRPT